MSKEETDDMMKELRQAVRSLLDVVWEMAIVLEAQGLAEKDWTDVVKDTFDLHVRRLGLLR